MAQTPQRIDDYGLSHASRLHHKIRNFLVRASKRIFLAGIYVGASGIGIGYCTVQEG